MRDRIAMCIFATGRYAIFLEGVVGTVRRFFLTDKSVEIVSFTDELPSPLLCEHRIHVPHLPWPNGTLYRYRWLASASCLREFSHLFMCDVDMEFVAPIGCEVLGKVVATIHGGHAGKNRRSLPVVTEKMSLAYRPPGHLSAYYAGGFQGGTAQHYLKACEQMADAIDEDEHRGVMADWHDESHWNAYLSDHPPEISLSPAYCWGEPEGSREGVKIVALDKQHEAFR